VERGHASLLPLNMKYTIEHCAQVIRGFIHTIREGRGVRMRLENRCNSGFKWPFEPPVISAITLGNEDT
jgi:hypothetical protein